MNFWNWSLVVLTIAALFYLALVCSKYMQSVADFLTARRGAGRYLIAVASGESALGVVSMIASLESCYLCGYAVGPFWGRITSMILLVLSLTGYCVYRFRETRAMTMGQFLEIRYNRPFRIYAAFLQTIAGLVNYAIIPAVGARAFIYYCDLPFQLDIYGWKINTFVLLMAMILLIALIIIMLGGQISIMLTDCLQGIISYPLYMIIVFFLLYSFSFHGDIFPALADRAPGESMLNPFDTKNLRVFNLFATFVGLVAAFLNRMSWSGSQGYNVSAINAHEQKMAGVLGIWRSGFAMMMFILLGIVVYTIFNSPKYIAEANRVSHVLINKVTNDVLNDDYKKVVKADIPTGSIKEIENKTYQAIREIDAKKGQTYRTLYNQMRGIVTIKNLLPTALVGVFCVLMLCLMVSTDTTCIHSWGSIIVQDIILPLKKVPFSPQVHLWVLRISMFFVAAFAFVFSIFFSQFDYINMFFAITSAIWLGGAGPCIVFGLYWKRGNSWGAFTALTSGTILAVGGFLLQGFWVAKVYPFLERNNAIPFVKTIVEGISRPFEPYILWRVTPDSFPMNSQEIYFIAMVVSTTLYIVVSLLTSHGRVCDMDKLLHRGKYRVEGVELKKQEWTAKGILRTLVGIDSNYTKSDRFLAWFVFYYGIVWGFSSWLFALIWNLISPWKIEWWGNWFFLFNYIIPIFIGFISTFWFFFGGIYDMKKFFKYLKETTTDISDDGRVEKKSE